MHLFLSRMSCTECTLHRDCIDVCVATRVPATFCDQLVYVLKNFYCTHTQDGVVDVCENASWMSAPTTGSRLRQLSDVLASKFDVCDPVMHAKLLMALATAKCYPGGAHIFRF